MKKISIFFILLIFSSFTACNLTTGNSEQAISIDTDDVIDMQTIGNWKITIHSAETIKEIKKRPYSKF